MSITHIDSPATSATSVSHVTAPTQFVDAGGVRYAYRRWGKPGTVPMFFIQHFRGGMDHWDPLMTDGLAAGREVVLYDPRGAGGSSGEPRKRFEDMADDIACIIRELGLGQVDLLGFSIGGCQAQEVALRHPELVRKLLLLGTGPRGGDPTVDPKMAEVALKPELDVDDFLFLFFGRSEAAKQAGREFWARRHERKDQDPLSSPEAIKAQWEAYEAYMVPVGESRYAHLNAIKHPTLVLNGIDDIMIATINSYYLGRNIPNAQVILYPDSGHGSQFQYPERFLKHALQFLDE
jgi:pimeloyl-ACP methyl ester carboxylesterase